MVGDMNHSKNGEVVKVSKTSQPSWELVLGGWLARFQDHYRQKLSKMSIDVYREMLSDLNVAELEAGCRQAIRSSEYMPTVATIRNALRSLRSIEATPSTYMPYPKVDPSERLLTAEEEKRISEVRRKLGIPLAGDHTKKKSPDRKTHHATRATAKSIADQKAELRRKGYQI